VSNVQPFLKWLEALPPAVFVHKTAWALTTVTVIHVFAIALVLGTIAIVDLRLLGFASPRRPFAELSRRVLPFTWTAFVIAVITGALLFISRASDYVANPVFWIKMLVIVFAGINMMVFEFNTVRSVQEWALKPPPPARLAGGISIACWVLVVALGRLIGFTLPIE
jgi:hypothetical protein